MPAISSNIIDNVRNCPIYLSEENAANETLVNILKEAREHKKLYNLSRLVGKPTMWFPNRSDTNQAAQSQKKARILKFCI